MTINNERLFHFANPNGCWHKWVRTTAPMSPVLIYKCSICKKLAGPLGELDELPSNPSYSTSPDDRERLLLYLVGKEEMRMQFYIWSHEKKEQGDCNRVIYDWPFVSWLCSPLDGVPRWVSLLSEWLGMDSTVERFGWVECPECHNTDYQCGYCQGRGKVLSEWAKCVKEAK